MIIDRKTVSDDVFDKLETLSKCVGQDPTRPMLIFTKLHVEKGQKYLVSTDGRCMAVYEVTHTRLPEILTAKRSRIYRILNAGKGKVIMEDATATCGITFPNWQRVDPDLSEYEKLVVLGEKAHSTRYTKLVYALSSAKKMPISLEIFDNLKPMGKAFGEVYVHRNEAQKAVVIEWGNDFRFIAMPIVVEVPVRETQGEHVA